MNDWRIYAIWDVSGTIYFAYSSTSNKRKLNMHSFGRWICSWITIEYQGPNEPYPMVAVTQSWLPLWFPPLIPLSFWLHVGWHWNNTNFVSKFVYSSTMAPNKGNHRHFNNHFLLIIVTLLIAPPCL